MPDCTVAAVETASGCRREPDDNKIWQYDNKKGLGKGGRVDSEKNGRLDFAISNLYENINRI